MDMLYSRRRNREDFLKQAEVYRQFEETLPKTDDYRQHRVELLLEGLPLGLYGILISNRSDFSDKAQTGAVITQVSNIGFLQRGQNNELPEFVVVNRESGAPIAGVNANFYRIDYRNRNRYKVIDEGKAITDQNGLVKAPKFARNLYVKFPQGDDVFLLSTSATAYESKPQ